MAWKRKPGWKPKKKPTAEQDAQAKVCIVFKSRDVFYISGTPAAMLLLRMEIHDAMLSKHLVMDLAPAAETSVVLADIARVTYVPPKAPKSDPETQETAP